MARSPFGFTLVELLLVIFILGLLAAMVTPLAGKSDELKRIRVTREYMETIRSALLGPRGRFDDKGRPILGGYVGDVGHLPELYVVQWDGPKRRWKVTWDSGESEPVTASENASSESVSPAGLWTDTLFPVEEHSGSDEYQLDEANWQGPYLLEPYDERDNQIFDYDEYSDTWANKELFESFETDGRLADAWGRNLAVYYTKKDGDYPKDMYFVSRGPDGKWDESSGILPHDPTGVGNRDNIVLSVNSNEWESITEDMKNRTRERLQEIRRALVGDTPVGTNYGYTGQTCRWPDLYNWDTATQKWTNSTGGNVYSIGQPRGLWDWDVISGMTPGWNHPGMTPFFSRYLEPPVYDAEELEEDKLKDAWGEEIYLFRDSDNATMLILSKGPDRSFTYNGVDDPDVSTLWTDSLTLNTNYDASVGKNVDNIVEWIRDRDWLDATVTIEFTVYNADNSTNGTKTTFYNNLNGVSVLNATSPSPGYTTDTWSNTWSVGNNATTGPRYILFWNDEDNENNSFNSTEDKGTLISVDVRKQSQGRIEIHVDADDFKKLGSQPPR
jgi:prepilin-type N-terminal cleavage/methylation domain-containing protein